MFSVAVLLTLMGKAGLVSSGSLIRIRKYAIVSILIIAAIVTPPGCYNANHFIFRGVFVV